MKIQNHEWLSIAEAASEYGIAYRKLHELVSWGVLTRGKDPFSTAEKRPRILLRVDEMDALRSGGVAAVVSMRAAETKGN